MTTSEQARADALRIGDFVKVVSGPAFAGPGTPSIKGRIQEITPIEGDAEVMVLVASGGLWGFMASHLERLPRRAVPGLRGDR